MADSQSVSATRMAHSISVGEVSSRTHQEGESEDHFESSSRTIHNENRCHAVTYLFYRINKTETITFSIEAIERRVIDPVAPTPVQASPYRADGEIAAIAQEVPATAKERLTSSSADCRANCSTSKLQSGGPVGIAARHGLPSGRSPRAAHPVGRPGMRPWPKSTRTWRAGLLDKEGGGVSKQTQKEFGFERKTSIPTAGIIVKGCIDTCDVCEPALEQQDRARAGSRPRDSSYRSKSTFSRSHRNTGAALPGARRPRRRPRAGRVKQ